MDCVIKFLMRVLFIILTFCFNSIRWYALIVLEVAIKLLTKIYKYGRKCMGFCYNISAHNLLHFVQTLIQEHVIDIYFVRTTIREIKLQFVRELVA